MVVVGGDGCLSAGVCGVLGVAVVVGWAEVQNNDRKRKTAISKSRSPTESHIFPLYNGFGANYTSTCRYISPEEP